MPIFNCKLILSGLHYRKAVLPDCFDICFVSLLCKSKILKILAWCWVCCQIFSICSNSWVCSSVFHKLKADNQCRYTPCLASLEPPVFFKFCYKRVTRCYPLIINSITRTRINLATVRNLQRIVWQYTMIKCGLLSFRHAEVFWHTKKRKV